MTGALVTATKSEFVKAACQGAIPWPVIATIQWHLFQLNMYYSVQVKRNPFAVYADYTFEDAYFQGCEKVFDTEQEALEYFQSFEDWEQDLLVVDYHPF